MEHARGRDPVPLDDTNRLCRPYGAWFFPLNNPRAAPVAKIVSPLRGFLGNSPLKEGNMTQFKKSKIQTLSH